LSCGLETSELYGNPELKSRWISWISQRGRAGLVAYLDLDEHAAVPEPDCVGFQLNRQPPSQMEVWQGCLLATALEGQRGHYTAAGRGETCAVPPVDTYLNAVV